VSASADAAGVATDGAPDAAAYDLHVLVGRLDKASERILQEGHGTSYRRFLALLAVRDLEPVTQRGLAVRLGVSEPSASRMATVLAGDGLVDVRPHPAGGNRRRVTLTGRGRELVSAGLASLEGRFAALVDRAGVSYSTYAAQTRALVTALGPGAS